MLTALICKGQNLVPNPSFEEYNTCPDFWDQISNCTGWDSYRETPDYDNTCSSYAEITPPNCYSGFQYPHSGNAFAGLYTFYYANFSRELIGAQLLSSLSIGQKYYISFYINLAGGDSEKYNSF